jgi:ribulose-bisphosphate carboxylase large chain
MNEHREWLTAVYEVEGPEAQARARAQQICLDQTIEAEAELLRSTRGTNVVGHLEDLQPLGTGRYQAAIRYRGDLLGTDCSDLLNLLFGTSSLRSDVRLLSFSLTKGLLSSWRGPRYGVAGLRAAVAVFDRPLLCAVLKPLGTSASELAALAKQFVLGGVDLIKEDQSLLDHSFCPFDERVGRCAEAIAHASAERGRPCLYFAHVSGGLDRMRERADSARRLGATGLLAAPGETGFDAFRALAADQTATLPIASHPSLLGLFVSRNGFSAAVAYGLLPRLAGADMTVYPGFGAGYRMTEDECIAVGDRCRRSMEHLLPTMPAIGGRIGVERIAELTRCLGKDFACVVGSRIQQDPRGVVSAIETVHRVLSRST